MASDAPLTQAQIDTAAFRVKRQGYIHTVLRSADQFLGSLLAIQDDQTISSQTEIDAHKKIWIHAFAVALNDGLDLLQPSHGQLAQVGDIVHAQEVIATDSAALQQETQNNTVTVPGA